MGGTQVVQALLGALERGGIRRNGTLLARVAAVVFGIAVFALFVGLGALGVWQAWQTGDWTEFTDSNFLCARRAGREPRPCVVALGDL